MKSLLLALLLFWQIGVPALKSPTDLQQYSRYRRNIVLSGGAGQTCAIIDAEMFPHAAASLKDIRLYQGERELPYAITLSEPIQADSTAARVLNLGVRGHSIVFDLEMSDRPYTDVDLDLAGHDYLATATVTGVDAPQSTSATHLGEFTLFDLTSQHLSHSTTLHLQESNFPYLRIGYGRAAHLIDLMHSDGLVGPADGSKPREILKSPDWINEVDAAIR